VVELDERSPGQIAYYEGAHAPGIFAPSGWHCRVWYGSSGSVFVVTPTPIEAPYFPPPKFRGKAVEVSNVVGEGSGRFSVATYASWLFPGKSEKFVQHVREESAKLLPPISRAPYPSDSITNQGSVAEFMTPANQKGLGTEGYLDPSQDGIRGIAILDEADPEWPSISVVRARLGSDTELEAAILRLNKACMQRKDPCSGPR
jgi:hypothetical protein